MVPTPISEAKLRRLRALQTRGMREKYGEFIVEGKRIVDEAFASRWQVECVCVSEYGRRHLNNINDAVCPAFVVDDNLFETLSATEHSQGIIAVVRALDEHLHEPSNGFIVALDRVADPGNVGTIIRTADWFGAQAVVLGSGCAELYNPKTVRSTMGSLFHLPVIPHADLRTGCTAMKAQGYAVWCADASGTPVEQLPKNISRVVLIIGSEAHGIEASLHALADQTISIQKYGNAESLNAASAAAAMLALMRAYFSF